MEPLTQKFIRGLHKILMTGTVDAYRQQVRPDEYRTENSRPRDRELLTVSRINSSLTELIRNYEHQTEIERNKECEENSMYYLSVRETAEKWGINISLVRRYCQQERIPGAAQKRRLVHSGRCSPSYAHRF